MGMDAAPRGRGRAWFLREPQATQNIISVMKGSRVKSGQLGQGLGPPLPYIQVSHPTGSYGDLQALPGLK